MNKIELLKKRRKQLFDAGADVRKNIKSIIDEDSFVELSSYSFSKNEFYGEDAEGEGVITGFAAIDGYPFYIIAQNFAVLSGGVSKANTQKMLKCLTAAEKNATPVLYILNSLGVLTNEGIAVLEGLAGVISKSAQLKGVLPQFCVVDGECYGQISLLAALSDFNFMTENAVLAYASPLVISAKSGKNLPKQEIGGVNGLTKANITSFAVKNIKEVRANISKIMSILPGYSDTVTDCEELNTVFPALNKKVTLKGLVEAVFDKDSYLETGSSFSGEVKCYIGRIGGISAAAVAFADGEGVRLNELNCQKIREFVSFAADFDLPVINLVNCKGIETGLEINNSLVLKAATKVAGAYNMAENVKIAVIYGAATGLGYTLFAAKGMGYDFTYALADSEVALFDAAVGAEVELKAGSKADAAKYAKENADPFNAAKGGYIDNIIEPAFIRQYIIASLQMAVR